MIREHFHPGGGEGVHIHGPRNIENCGEAIFTCSAPLISIIYDSQGFARRKTASYNEYESPTYNI